MSQSQAGRAEQGLAQHFRIHDFVTKISRFLQNKHVDRLQSDTVRQSWDLDSSSHRPSLPSVSQGGDLLCLRHPLPQVARWVSQLLTGTGQRGSSAECVLPSSSLDFLENPCLVEDRWLNEAAATEEE